MRKLFVILTMLFLLPGLSFAADLFHNPNAAPNGFTVTGTLSGDTIESTFVDVTGNIDATGNITGSAFFGDGSNLTGVSAGSADSVQITARKGTAGTIAKGEVVYVTGYNTGGAYYTVEKAQANSASTMASIGVVSAQLTDSASGTVVTSGRITGLDTSSWSVNDNLYVSEATAGLLTDTKPTGAANAVQKVAVVAFVNASTGIIHVVGAGRTNDLPNIADGKLWMGNASDVPTAVTPSGDATISNAGVISLAADSVDANEIVTDAVGLSELHNQTEGYIRVGQSSGDDLSVAVSGDISLSAAGATSLAADSVDSAEIAQNAVGVSELFQQASGNIVVGQASGDDSSVAVSGDATLAATGALSLANDSVAAAEIVDDSVGLAELHEQSEGNIRVGQATGDDLSVSVSGDISLSAAGAVALATDSVAANEIVADSVGLEELHEQAEGNIRIGQASGDDLSVAVSGDVSITAAGVTEVKSIRVYTQASPPTLSDGEIAIFVDTSDSNKVYLIYDAGAANVGVQMTQ